MKDHGFSSLGIPEWFKGRKILVTGGTGFMGKVLLEKLLRCCPDIDTIYILIRSKKGVSGEARLAVLSKLPLFERLLKENPKALKKLKAIEGDLTIFKGENLGGAVESSVIFHLGASLLSLDGDLRSDISANTQGTLNVLDLATKMKNLVAFVHVSTAFCHPDIDVLEERLYPINVKPSDILNGLKWMNPELLAVLTPRLLGKHPNTYTFSKKLAEGLLQEYKEIVPITVVRPSIVCPTIKEPMPGWVDSLNGPIGVLVGAGKGVIRSMLCVPKHTAEVIPADIAINSIIAAAWIRGRNGGTKGEIPVYNASCGQKVSLSWGNLIEKGKQVLHTEPFEPGIWYPNGSITTNPFKHAFIVFFLQILPAYLIDFLMVLTKHKTFMVRIQKKILFGMKLLQFFTMKNWTFKTEKTLGLTDNMNERDKKIFFLGNEEYDIDKYIRDLIVGSRVYCLKEPLSTIPRAKKQLKLMYIIDLITKVTFMAFLCWVTFKYISPLFSFMNVQQIMKVPEVLNIYKF